MQQVACKRACCAPEPEQGQSAGACTLMMPLCCRCEWDQVTSLVTSVNAAFPGKPIWITEVSFTRDLNCKGQGPRAALRQTQTQKTPTGAEHALFAICCSLLGFRAEGAPCGLLHIHSGKAAPPTAPSRVHHHVAFQMLQVGCKMRDCPACHSQANSCDSHCLWCRLTATVTRARLFFYWDSLSRAALSRAPAGLAPPTLT